MFEPLDVGTLKVRTCAEVDKGHVISNSLALADCVGEGMGWSFENQHHLDVL